MPTSGVIASWLPSQPYAILVGSLEVNAPLVPLVSALQRLEGVAQLRLAAIPALQRLLHRGRDALDLGRAGEIARDHTQRAVAAGTLERGELHCGSFPGVPPAGREALGNPSQAAS